jgi:Histidine kinase
MIALAHTLPMVPRWRVLDWVARAWRRLTWRHVVLALGLQIGRELIGPLGGVFFLPVPATWDPLTKFLDGSWLIGGAAIVWCVLVANEAFDDGVPPLRAYGLAVISFSLFVPVAYWALGGHFGWRQEETPSIAWWASVLLFQGGLGTSIYAYWRVTQRSMRRAQAAETERLRNEQRVQTSRLLALQARVEPQMLFDSLGRVAALHVHEPQAADALLADLIALLRAMQPRQTTDNSTVEREFALVEAWIRVSRSAARGAPRVRLQMAPDCRALGIAPMLVLPLLRAALASYQAAEPEWVLSAYATGARLIVTLEWDADIDVTAVSASQEFGSLHERLLRLFGRSAGLAVLPHIPALTLDLPRLQEDPDDDSPDR